MRVPCVPLWQPCLRFKPFICWRHFVTPHIAHTHTHTLACWQKTCLSLSGFAFSAPHLFYVFIALFACVLFSARYLLCTHKQKLTHTYTQKVVCSESLFDISLNPAPASFFQAPPSLFITLRDWQLLALDLSSSHRSRQTKHGHFGSSLNAPREWLISKLTFMCDLSGSFPTSFPATPQGSKWDYITKFTLHPNWYK